MHIEEFEDGFAICGDATSTEVTGYIKERLGPVPLIVTDPPYGNVVTEKWDRWRDGQKSFVEWMLGWTNSYADLLLDGGAFYVWGGYGVPGFRPFFEYLSRVEGETPLRMANFVTWSKRRGYGVQHNYLACREDLAYFIKGDPKKPVTFNVPYLNEKRGYAGFDKRHPAKSEYYRRSNVWGDVNELFSGKVHPTQKPLRVIEVPIEVNTSPGDWVVDPFTGSMTTAWAARRLGRKWACVERDPVIFDSAVDKLRNGLRKR